MPTLLEIFEEVCDELTIARPTIVIGSENQTVRTLLAHAQREGRQQVRLHDWTALERIHTFTTTASTAEYSLPTDYSRLINDTEWDRADEWPLIGPLTPQEYQHLQSSGLSGGIIGRRYRIVRSGSSPDRKILIEPTPTVTSDTLAFHYISKSWCKRASDDALQTAWTLDSDELLLDEDLYKIGMQIRYLRSRGLEFGSEVDEYTQLLSVLKAQDTPSPTLSMIPSRSSHLINRRNLPQTGYGS